MNPIVENIMALADEYMRWGGKDRDRQALRAAIEQELGPQPKQEWVAMIPGDVVAWLHPANPSCVTTDPTAYARGIPLVKAHSQPKQEAVAEVVLHHSYNSFGQVQYTPTVRWLTEPPPYLAKLYTAPQPQREWVGLSGEEITQQCRTVGVGSYQTLAAAFKAGVEFANAKLRELNGGGV